MSASKTAKESLSLARSYAKERRDKEASLEYEWFFDNALSLRPSYYGVRLSYCLAEWHAVAKRYRPAMIALHAKRELALKELVGGGAIERFHDYVSISSELGLSNEIVSAFRLLDEEYPSIAPECWRYAQQYFIDLQEWAVCSKYLSDPVAQCDKLLDKFRQAMDVYKEDPKLFSNRDEQIVGWLVTDCHNLLNTLQYSQRFDEESEALQYICQELKRSDFERHISNVSDYKNAQE